MLYCNMKFRKKKKGKSVGLVSETIVTPNESVQATDVAQAEHFPRSSIKIIHKYTRKQEQKTKRTLASYRKCPAKELELKSERKKLKNWAIYI